MPVSMRYGNAKEQQLYFDQTGQHVMGYCRRTDNRYEIVLFTTPGENPAFDLGVTSHEIAHVRYGSLEHESALVRHTAQWGNLAGVWRGVWNYLEDTRIEYRLLMEFPHALPYIAALRTMIRDVVAVKAPDGSALVKRGAGWLNEMMEVLRDFVRLGEYPRGWRAEMDFLAPRLTLLARSHDSEDSMRLASAFLGYVLLRRNVNVPKVPMGVKQEVDPNKLGDIEDIVDRLVRAERSRQGRSAQGGGSGGSGGIPSRGKHVKRVLGAPRGQKRGSGIRSSTPWGGTRGKWRDVLRALKTQLAGGGVSISEVMEILDAAVESSTFVAQVEDARRDDIQRATEAFKCVESRADYYALDGAVAIDRQQDAYAQSFAGPDDQGKVYRRRRRIPAEFDAVVVVDVSGSMHYSRLTEPAMSDTVVLVKALGSYTRLAVFGVDTDLHVYKRFDDRLDESRFAPRGRGGTNFQHFFTRLPEVAEWVHARRMVFIVSDGEWYWQPGDFLKIREQPYYQDIEWYVTFLQQRWMNDTTAVHAVEHVFKQVYPDLMSAVAAATGARWGS